MSLSNHSPKGELTNLEYTEKVINDCKNKSEDMKNENDQSFLISLHAYLEARKNENKVMDVLDDGHEIMLRAMFINDLLLALENDSKNDSPNNQLLLLSKKRIASFIGFNFFGKDRLFHLLADRRNHICPDNGIPMISKFK